MRRPLRRRHLLALGAVSGALLAAVALPPAQASDSADENDFSYSSWDARFTVGLDDSGRAVLHVEERLVADFPDRDQNRGIVRGYPQTYQHADTQTRILAITDENDAPVPFETEEDDDVLYVLTGTDEFVRGPVTYVIEYEMRDVILPAKNGLDEFYWDLLPLDSTQDIESFRAEIVFDKTLSEKLTGTTACYQGLSGSETSCPLSGPTLRDGEAVFTVASGFRAAGDGVTVAIGLESGTAQQPVQRSTDPATDIVPFGFGAAVLALSGGAIGAVAHGIRSRRRATGIVIAQYEVPDSLPPLIAGELIPRSADAIPAEFVHLAVRGAIRLEKLASKKTRPRLRLVDPSAVGDPLDADTVDLLFPSGEKDAVRKIPRNSESFAALVAKLKAKATREAALRGLTTKTRSRLATVLQIAALVALGCGFVFSIAGVVLGRAATLPAFFTILVLGILLLIAGLFAFSAHRVLTPAGAAALEHLRGAEEFIRVAEADRIRMLQSYTGAERRPDGEVDVVVLYERLLPYAMLFGQEKEWAQVLQTAYDQTGAGTPWSSVSPANALFAASLGSFTEATVAGGTYSSPSSGVSSGTGGSMGGGFSGGGGGGGFSGGR